MSLKPTISYYDIIRWHPKIESYLTSDNPQAKGFDGVISDSNNLESATQNFSILEINIGDMGIISGQGFFMVTAVNVDDGSITIDTDFPNDTGYTFTVGGIAMQMYEAWLEILDTLDNNGIDYLDISGEDDKFRFLHIWLTLKALYRVNVGLQNDRIYYLEDKINKEADMAWENIQFTNDGGSVMNISAVQHTYQMVSDLLSFLTIPVFIYSWLETGAPVTETDLSNSDNDATFNNFTSDSIDIMYLINKLTFDSSVYSYLNVTDDADLSFDDNQDFSIGAWINIPTAANVIVSKYDDVVGDTKKEYVWDNEATRNQKLTLYDNTNGGNISIVTSTPPSADWHFVVFTFDGVDKDGLKVYIDGELQEDAVTALSGTYSDMDDSDIDLIIGAKYSNNTLGSYFSSDMGVVFSTREELTAIDIYKMYLLTRSYYNK